MFHKIFGKSQKQSPNITESSLKVKQNECILKKKIQDIIKEEKLFESSYFYMSYMDTFLQLMYESFDKQIEVLNKEFQKNTCYEQQKVSIYLQMTEKEGIFYQIITLWVSFCDFEIKKIQQGQGNDQQKTKGIIALFHRQYCLLCLFVYRLVIYLYGKPFNEYKQKIEVSDIYHYVRNQITACSEFTKIHNIIVKSVEIISQNFAQKQVNQNMSDLEELVKISEVPAPYMDSINLLRKFYRERIIDAKVKIAVKLIEKLKQQTIQYRKLNGLQPNFIFAADHVFCILTFLVWKTERNISGACAYIEMILGSQYEQINPQIVSQELNMIDPNARYCFEAIKNVSLIKRVPIQKFLHSL